VGYLIIIDAGHGGKDPGACANGIQEKDWTLEVSLYQYKRFQELGIPVLMTRSGDITLDSEKRANIVKTSGADICISNHFNAGGGTGCEVIHSIFSKSTLANSIAKEIETVGMQVRRVFSKSGYGGKDYYYMHRLTGNVKTIIVEYGFLDHKEDFYQLSDKDNRLGYAEAVIKAICYWVGHSYHKDNENNSQQTTQFVNELYCVQVGAFEKRENAEVLVKKLKDDGYQAIIK
jgi:N-acetylmuramoyl-L-alanine amidase